MLLSAVVLALPAAALAQASTAPDGNRGLSRRPPVQLGGGSEGGGRSSAPSSPAPRASAARGRGLANTGSDPRRVIAVGAALMLLGLGLRLRTADADLY